jgi:GntR family transcriptional regulator
VSVYQQIADDLRERITSGDLRPGDDVPTEGELAARWRTSRGPVRNALALLRAQGLVESTRGRPSRVAARTVRHPVDTSVPFTRWAREIGARPGARTQSVTLHRVDGDRARLLGVDPGDLVVDVLRLRTLDDRPTMLERLTYVEDVGRLLLAEDLDAVSITEVLLAHGYDVGDVDHEIDAVAADEDDARLLEVPTGSPVLRLRRFSWSGGRVFEAGDDRYRSDVVRFTVATTGRRRPTGPHFVRPVGR